MNKLIAELNRLVAARREAFEDFKAAFEYQHDPSANDASERIDRLDKQIAAAVGAANERPYVLYGEYLRAHAIAERLANSDGDPLWLAVEGCRQEWERFRAEAGLQAGELRVSEYTAYRAVRK